jgi:hypothetical protein
MLHDRLYYKENNSKACNRMPKYNIMTVGVQFQMSSLLSHELFQLRHGDSSGTPKQGKVRCWKPVSED